MWGESTTPCGGGVSGKVPKPNERHVPLEGNRFRPERFLGTLEAQDAEAEGSECVGKCASIRGRGTLGLNYFSRLFRAGARDTSTRAKKSSREESFQVAKKRLVFLLTRPCSAMVDCVPSRAAKGWIGPKAGRPGKAVRQTWSTDRCEGDVQLFAPAGSLGKPQSPTKGRYHQGSSPDGRFWESRKANSVSLSMWGERTTPCVGGATGTAPKPNERAVPSGGPTPKVARDTYSLLHVHLREPPRCFPRRGGGLQPASR